MKLFCFDLLFSCSLVCSGDADCGANAECYTASSGDKFCVCKSGFLGDASVGCNKGECCCDMKM